MASGLKSVLGSAFRSLPSGSLIASSVRLSQPGPAGQGKLLKVAVGAGCRLEPVLLESRRRCNAAASSMPLVPGAPALAGVRRQKRHIALQPRFRRGESRNRHGAGVSDPRSSANALRCTDIGHQQRNHQRTVPAAARKRVAVRSQTRGSPCQRVLSQQANVLLDLLILNPGCGIVKRGTEPQTSQARPAEYLPVLTDQARLLRCTDHPQSDKLVGGSLTFVL